MWVVDRGSRPRSQHGGAAEAGMQHHGAGARQRVGAAEAGVDERASAGGRSATQSTWWIRGGRRTTPWSGRASACLSREAGVDEHVSGRR